MGWKATKDLNPTSVVSAYNDEKDFALYKRTPTSFVDIHPGQFVIFFPEDAHAPIIGTGKIRKMVGKVKL